MAVIGKTGVERSFRLTWDGDDLSGDLVPGSVDGGGFAWDEVDMTGVSEAARNFLAGHKASEISGQFILNDAQTAGVYDRSYSLVRDLRNIGTLTLQWGLAGAAPASGNPEFEGGYILLSAPVTFDGGRPIITATWQQNGSTAAAWGTVA